VEITERATRACDEYNLKAEVDYEAYAPAVHNDERLYKIFHEVGCELLGPDHVIPMQVPSMGSEDFGYYIEHLPGLLFRLGLGLDHPGLHQAHFDFNDQALRTGMLMMAGLALKISKEGIST
jgi:metal-dependent amidase/aminoacylase/carboxypeptidase family protein